MNISCVRRALSALLVRSYPSDACAALVRLLQSPLKEREAHRLVCQSNSSGSRLPATCFPPACTTASSWNPHVLWEVGAAIAEEALQDDIAVVLGPGVNIKRNPLCGRNFEYFSEDPILTGELASAFISGLQTQG